MRVRALLFDYMAAIRFSTQGLSYRLLSFSLALIYGGVLASLPLDVFMDRTSYLVYAEASWTILQGYWSLSPLVGLANEPLWLLMNAGLAKVLAPEAAVRITIFVPAVVVAWLVLERDPRQFGWLLLFLAVPQIIKNHIVHLRQGVAISVFLAGWLATRQPLRWLFMAAAAFIHASYFFVLALLVVAGLARTWRLAVDLRTFLFGAAGLGVGVALAWLASLLGARQGAEYAFSAAETSGLGFLFWGMVFAVMCLQGRAFLRRHAFELGTIVFYLATYFFVEVTARIFESTMLIVLFAGLRLTGWRRLAFLSLILTFVGLQWATRADQPWLGFGFL